MEFLDHFCAASRITVIVLRCRATCKKLRNLREISFRLGGKVPLTLQVVQFWWVNTARNYIKRPRTSAVDYNSRFDCAPRGPSLYAPNSPGLSLFGLAASSDFLLTIQSDLSLFLCLCLCCFYDWNLRPNRNYLPEWPRTAVDLIDCTLIVHLQTDSANRCCPITFGILIDFDSTFEISVFIPQLSRSLLGFFAILIAPSTIFSLKAFCLHSKVVLFTFFLFFTSLLFLSFNAPVWKYWGELRIVVKIAHQAHDYKI